MDVRIGRGMGARADDDSGEAGEAGETGEWKHWTTRTVRLPKTESPDSPDSPASYFRRTLTNPDSSTTSSFFSSLESLSSSKFTPMESEPMWLHWIMFT
jgi:hypothetical protein